MWHNPFQLLLIEWHSHWAAFWWLWIIFIVALVMSNRQPPGGNTGA